MVPPGATRACQAGGTLLPSPSPESARHWMPLTSPSRLDAAANVEAIGLRIAWLDDTAQT